MGGTLSSQAGLAFDGMSEDRVCGAGWVWTQYPSIHMRYGVVVELTSQLYLLICAFAGVGDGPNLILHWLVHPRVISEVIPR